MLLPFSGVGELYFQVQHFNKKEFIQKLLYNVVIFRIICLLMFYNSK